MTNKQIRISGKVLQELDKLRIDDSEKYSNIIMRVILENQNLKSDIQMLKDDKKMLWECLNRIDEKQK